MSALFCCSSGNKICRLPEPHRTNRKNTPKHTHRRMSMHARTHTHTHIYSPWNPAAHFVLYTLRKSQWRLLLFIRDLDAATLHCCNCRCSGIAAIGSARRCCAPCTAAQIIWYGGQFIQSRRRCRVFSQTVMLFNHNFVLLSIWIHNVHTICAGVLSK